MKKIKDWEITQRFNSKTPTFWKKVIRAGVSVGVFCGGALAIIATGGIAAPAVVGTILTVGASVGAAFTIAAKLAKIDVSDIENMDHSELQDTYGELERKALGEGLTAHEQRLFEAAMQEKKERHI